ncbi:unnamed protein product [Pelagomonas calceolata]|uniref:Uncharacterized protein n=1 Tax=Pelagomonas calceolata TaxID=35677 RepID=A0A7S4A3W7_9STRA|nr:unnamed protein product [Pelagomonas calceolata]|mmetsp:Transcript_9340/g.29019  ORF Transcript_9340/g.29019 Transcript_9340/m.29019 type:complete len:591 (-) Transcript_9340:40-1812(-)
MERPGGLGGSQEAAARDRADLKKQLAQAAAQTQGEEDLRDAPRHVQQRTPRTSPQKPSRQTPNAGPHGRRRTGDAQAPGAQAPGAAETTSSEGGLTGALGQAADQLSQMLVDQESRATTSEGRLRAEDAEARDHDGDHSIEEAPAADAAPAAAPAAASAWCDDDRIVLKALRSAGSSTGHRLSLARLRKAAERHGLTIRGKKDAPKLKKALEAAEPASSSSDDEDGIVPGARVRTLTHGAGVVLGGLAGNGCPRVRLDVPFLPLAGVYKSEVAIPKAQLTRLAPGDAGYEAPSTTGAAGSGTTAPSAAGSGAGAAFALKVARVLGRPAEHALGFAAPPEVVAPRAAPTLVVPQGLIRVTDANEILDRAADEAQRALGEHLSKLEALKADLDQKEAEAKMISRTDLDQQEAHVKDAREAYAAEAAKGPQLKAAFAEASRARIAAMLTFCPALADLIRNDVDPLREEEAEQEALRRRVSVQLANAESDAAKQLGKSINPRNGSVLWDVAPHRGTPPRGVLALQCPRGNCRARYWFPFKEIHDVVMRNSQKSLACKKEGCGFRMCISLGDFGDRRAREDEMDDELERWGFDFA